jgi:pullulanase/glycogen debranching enzyme
MLPKTLEVKTGKPYPLGATHDGSGTNFSLFSEVASKVELCLFDDDGKETRLSMPENTANCWHCYLPNVGAGQLYGYRVYGPWQPQAGQRCNPHKLLLDPYAKAIEGELKWDEALFSYYFGKPQTERNDSDSAPYFMKSAVINPYFDWSDDRNLRIPWHNTIIYETHVKGFTCLHPDIPRELQGTYAGLGHPVTINYLQRLGITALELLPVHQFIHDKTLIDKGLRNYWGYNSIGYFAPHNEYAADKRPGMQVPEFKQMVKNLHRAGIEVILDVVYNHTAEGNHLGPTLSFRGIDNAAYYRLAPEEPEYYFDFTGTGNSLNMRHPQILQMIMDSLRYWITEMHVDGFTLADLVTYNHKHNEANKENNQDGDENNHSWNCGVEGSTDNPQVIALRQKQKRNFLTTLFLSQGVPMLLGGDEFGRTQSGNNNSYCQDNPLSWYHWEQVDQKLLEFTRRLIQFRRHNPVFHRRRWFQGRPIHDGGTVEDIKWFTPGGEEMVEASWKEGQINVLGVYLNGEGFTIMQKDGKKTTSSSYFLLFNADRKDAVFYLSCPACATQWQIVLATNEDWYEPDKAALIPAGSQLKVEAHSFLLLKRMV